MNEILEKEKKSNDITLRPKTLSEYVGQENIKKNIEIFIKSAKKRNDTLDHMLFYGPPGLGKTTIASIIANEMGSKLKITTGPAIEKGGDLAAILSNLEEGDILFIDEIHRLPKAVEEILYPAMEDYCIDILIGNGTSSKTVRLPLEKFTLIGATTRVGMLSAPLRDRFGSVNRLELYKPEDLGKIIKRDAPLININITDEAAFEIGKRSRGTPRIAIRILKRIRDFAIATDKTEIDLEIAKYALKELKIDDNGLDETDIRILKAIHENFSNGPVGLETLSAFIGEDQGTIEDVCEPYLMQIGFISKTPRGRVLNQIAIDYLSNIDK